MNRTAFIIGFSIKDDVMQCREGYADSEAVLAHIENCRLQTW